MSPEPQLPNKTFKDFLKVFVMPLLVNKIFMLYFGLNYANNPGEGYGYGLTATILFLLATCVHFVWKYRHIEDP
jgi:hypothetical protein